MAQNISLLNAVYYDVPSVRLPKEGGGMAQFDDTTDANATAADIRLNKTAWVNGVKLLGTNPGGGGSGLTLLAEQSFGAISTSNTTAADAGKSISVPNATDYDVLIVDVSVDTVVNNRHTSTVSFVFITGTSNVNNKNTVAVASNKWNSRRNSSGTGITRQSTTAYGIYAYSASISGTTIDITAFYQRYNSNNTGTINGNYTCRVYGLKLYDLIGG